MDYQIALNTTLAETLRVWAPPPKLTLSEWADAYAFLSPESAAQDGKWKTLPYQKGIMDAMTDPTVEKLTIQKSARVGYTKMINHLIAYHVHQDPCNILVVQPTIEDAQGYSKDEIVPMLRDTPVLVPLAPESKTRDSSNTILRKQFPAMTLMITGANSARGFRRISARKIVFDEVSAYPPSAGSEGDPIALGSRRADFYWNKLIIHGSTPTFEGDRIETLFKQSDQRYYNVPCPFCDFMQTLEWSNIDFTSKGSVRKPVYLCADCEKAIEYSRHRWMIERGAWEATAPFDGHAGFFIWSAYSYSPNATWRHIVKAFLEMKDDPLTLKTWVNTWRGQTWKDEAETNEADTLRNRRENYGVIMPLESAILTCTADMQDDRIELLVKAWGKDEENWDIEHMVIPGDPATKEFWDEKVDVYLQKSFPHMNGSTVSIHCTLIDSGGHHTDAVYRFVKSRRMRNVYAIRGSKDPAAPLISRPKKSKLSKSYKMGVDLITIGVKTAKDLVASRLRLKEPGPGFIHFPARFGDEYFDQLASEKRTRKYVKGVMIQAWEPVRAGIRNEAWDLEVYQTAAIRMVCPDVSMLNQYVEAAKNNKYLISDQAPGRRMRSRGIKDRM